MKQAGAKGLAIDFESYGAHQFKFDASKGRSFADTATLARKRGGQFVQVVAREFPDAVLLTLWMNSINLKAGASDTPDVILTSSGYGLLPAFIDGMLDDAPPAMVFVDGCENGYYMDSAEEYLRAAHEMRSWNGSAIRLVSPANRAKYRQQVQAGFGFYLDMFLNEATNRYYRGPLNGSRLARLERNLGFACEAADEYVWVYGEQCRWWGQPLNVPKSVGQGRLWEEAMPGITRAIAYVRDRGQDEQHKRNWLDCIRSRQRPNADVELGHLGTIPAHLGNVAYRVGRRIRWDGAKETIPGDSQATELLARAYRKPYVLPKV